MAPIKKQFLCIIYAMVLITAFTVQAGASSVIRWGLKYEKAEEIPVGNATSEYLKTFNAYYHGTPDSGSKILYLTFDAGYENGFTPKLLDTLKENNVPAAFFLVGTYLKSNPELVKRMVDEGHIIGNHSMKHANMSKKSAKDFKADLKQFEERYESVVGAPMSKYYRPPEGVFTEANLIAAKEAGYKTVLWSATYVDWDTKKQPTKAYAFEKLLPRLHPGAIILLHSTSATNADILGELIAKCRELGYEFKGLDDL